MIQFVKANLKGIQTDTSRPDYYKVLEAKIEERKEHFAIETRIELMIGEVQNRMLDWEKAKAAEARINMRSYEAKELVQVNLKDRLKQDMNARQEAIIAEGYTLGFNIETETNTYPEELKVARIEEVVKTITNELNQSFNEEAFARSWTMMNGRVFKQRSLYVLAHKFWKELAVERVETEACFAWEEIFGDEEACGAAAVEARVNERMSKVAREQGRMWARRNHQHIVTAEVALAQAFEEAQSGQPEDKATRALDIVADDQPGGAAPKERARASCWAKLNPDPVQTVREQQYVDMSEEFALAMGQGVAEKCVQIMNDICEEEFKQWFDKAHQWRNINMDEYMVAEKAMIDNSAEIFAKEYESETAKHATKITSDAAIMKYMTDPEAIKENGLEHEADIIFQAKCWGTRNQGKMRTALQKLRRAHDTSARYNWMEIVDQTEKFVKGSYLTTSQEHKRKPADDRYFGFRNRMEARYDWMHAYYMTREQDLTEEIIKLEYNNPLGKGFANLRPSNAEKTKRKLENDYIQERNANESALAEVISKLSQWNSYFGTVERAAKKTVPMSGDGDAGSVADDASATGEATAA
jgi:hypothetical protein